MREKALWQTLYTLGGIAAMALYPPDRQQRQLMNALLIVERLLLTLRSKAGFRQGQYHRSPLPHVSIRAALHQWTNALG